MTEKYDVLIIGSGISGLTSALLMAKKGKSVAIAEQYSHIAPLLAGFERNGVHFETGFHYSAALDEDEIGGFLFKELGLDIPIELCDEDNYDEVHLLETNRVFQVPIGAKKLEERLISEFPKEKEAVKKYMSLVKETLAEVPFLNFHKKDFSHDELLNLPKSEKTLKQILDENFKSEEIKAILSFPFILYGTPPAKVSFTVHCCCVGLMFDSVWTIKGGAKTLIKAFEEALNKYNVKIFTNKKAVKIKYENDKKTVKFSDSSVIECDICISAVHPKEFAKIAPEGTYRKNHIERIDNLEETPAFSVLYGALEKGIRYKTINKAFLKKNNFDEVFPMGKEQIFYLNFSNTDPQAVCAVLFSDPSEKLWDLPQKEYKEKKKEVEKEIKAKIQFYYPEILGKIMFYESAVPATFKKYINYYSGYGIRHDINAVPVLPITKIPGLFLTGQGVVTPGLLGAMISSFLLDKLMEKGNQS